MNYRRLGKSGLKVSALSLGGWTTFGDSVADHRLARDILVKAYDNGINFFDIANVYARGEAEKLMGSVLRLFPRHTLVISSKAFWPMSDDVNDRGLSRKHLFESVHASLRRIGTDYLDLFFCHRWDAETPLEETVRALDALVHQGKILYWGTSEWTGAQIQAALDRNLDRVTFVGPYAHRDVGRLMAHIDWVVVPSIWWENAPMVIQEAFMHGRPVICSDIGGMAEAVTHGVDGLHFRVGDPWHLADVIRSATGTPGLWQQLRAGIQPVRQVETTSERLCASYLRLLGQSRRQPVGAVP